MLRTVGCLLLVGAFAVPAAAQGQPAKGGIDWQTATPELPKKREQGVIAEGPVEGPEKPQLKELDGILGRGFPVLLYWWWPAPDGPGRGCAVWKEKIFSEPEVPDAVSNGEYVCLRVNAMKCPPEVMKRYRVGKIPTLQLWTCDGKVAKTFTGAGRDPKSFMAALAMVSTKNDVIRRKRAALRKKLEKEFERIDRLKDDGKLDEAREAYAKLEKKHGADVAEDCKWGRKEIKMIEVAAEGERLFKAGKYLEAKGRLSVVSDFEVPCPARDLARRLLPDCAVGVRIQQAELVAKEGKVLEAIEQLQAIVDDVWYDGPMKETAAAKITELRDAWGKK